MDIAGFTRPDPDGEQLKAVQRIQDNLHAASLVRSTSHFVVTFSSQLKAEIIWFPQRAKNEQYKQKKESFQY
jgi:hypothetical protein